MGTTSTKKKKVAELSPEEKEEQELKEYTPMEQRFFMFGGGIYTKPTLKKILGKRRIPGKDLKKKQFWEKQRSKAKAALIDLEAFIVKAGEGNLSQVITKESLEPIVTSLLYSSVALDKTRLPDVNRAEIAQLFIKWSFEYLAESRPDLMTLPHEQAKNMAIDLSNFITESIKSKSKAGYSTPGRATYKY